ncbi:MAG: Lrp/AsnC family transcriptional regulator [Hellea sp.]|nr:Lrp/AsnC family transcriptional regulator [Hellea sp.]|tara:strand:- start:1868 stop:2329 length:462 start_codon:yes stop_codon:yes gene_type:complete
MTEIIDSIDLKILRILQSDSSRSLESISNEVGVSLNTCWRRISRMEKKSIIEGRVALIDNVKVGLPLTVFVSISTDDHSQEWTKKLSNAVISIKEIVEFYRLAGETDYILKMMVKNVDHYDKVYKQLINSVKISDVSASFAMEKIKFTTDLPI